jgi:hypothetical protein
MSQRHTRFGYCSKGGHSKQQNDCFVCGRHWNSAGLYTHCAVCGGDMPSESRNYVHAHCRVRNT